MFEFLLGGGGELAGGNEDAAGGVLGGDEASEGSDGFDADVLFLPVFALDEGGLVVAAEAEVDAAVGGVAAGVFDGVAVAFVVGGEEGFEFLPGELADGVAAGLGVESFVVEVAFEEAEGPGDEEEAGEVGGGFVGEGAEDVAEHGLHGGVAGRGLGEVGEDPSHGDEDEGDEGEAELGREGEDEVEEVGEGGRFTA